MDKEQIIEILIKILTNHRQLHGPERPKALTAQSIIGLIKHSLSPNHIANSDLVRECLQELQAQGEILAGLGNQFCIAPPTILVEDETNFVGALFIGDRAYLKLAHQALETGQPIFKTQLHPKIHGFYRIQERLRNHGIRLLTVTECISHLPIPEKPKLHILSGAEWHENPFQCWSTSGLIQAYLPKSQWNKWNKQRERWQSITQTNLTSDSLLKLSTGEYLWFAADQFYELSPDAASLTMFWLDQQVSLPSRVLWDEGPGRLDLQETILPGSYAQWLWRLSKPDPNQPRTRLFEPPQRTIVRQALIRLGCSLV
jgi:hypothetical protein